MGALGLACEGLARGLGRAAPLTRYRVRSTAARVRFDCSRAARDLGWRPGAASLLPVPVRAAPEGTPVRETQAGAAAASR
jgi:hypothetical protein